MKNIKSIIFGDVKFLYPDDEAFDEVQGIVEAYPANVFGALNKKLNKLGFKINIIRISEEVNES